MLDGPIGTVYEGGVFFIDIRLEGITPHLKPVTTFKTKIYHPSVKDDGSFCNEKISTFWDDIAVGWISHGMTIRDIMVKLQTLLESGQDT